MSFERNLLCLVLLGAMSSQALAALPPLSPDELEQSAALIVTGSVLSIDVTTSGLGRNVDWVIKLQAKVDSVSKGNVQAGDTVSIHCWRVKKRPAGWAGPSGHYSIPAEGSQFEMWLRQRDEGDWQPLQPNGIRLLDGSKAFDFESASASQGGRGTLYLILLVGVLAGVAAWSMARRRKSTAASSNAFDPSSATGESADE